MSPPRPSVSRLAFIVFAAIFCLFSVAALSGCDEEDNKAAAAKIQAQIKANPELARQVAEQLRVSGLTLGQAGKTIATNSQGVRADIHAQAPALALTTDPKLDAIDQGAQTVTEQAAVIIRQRDHINTLEGNITSLEQERDRFEALFAQEQLSRAADAAAAAKELEVANSRVYTMLYGLGAVLIIGCVVLVGVGIYVRNGWVICGGIAALVAGLVLIGIGMFLKVLVLGCLGLVGAIITVLGGVWVFSHIKAAKAAERQDMINTSAEGLQKLLTTRNRMILELIQLGEHLKAQLPQDLREKIFGGATDHGMMTSFLSDDTMDYVDSVRKFDGVKLAPKISPLSTTIASPGATAPAASVAA